MESEEWIPGLSLDTKDALEFANRRAASYAGANARLWHYTVTHKRVAIRVRHEGATAGFLVFINPKTICMPTHWRMVKPAIRRKDMDTFIFTDDNVQIEFDALVYTDEYEYPDLLTRIRWTLTEFFGRSR